MKYKHCQPKASLSLIWEILLGWSMQAKPGTTDLKTQLKQQHNYYWEEQFTINFAKTNDSCWQEF